MTAGYLYATRRGKFEVWTGLLNELDLRGLKIVVRATADRPYRWL